VGDPTLKDTSKANYVSYAQSLIAMSAGDNAAALAAARKIIAAGDTEFGPQNAAIACALLHDNACMRASWAMLAAVADPENMRDSAIQQMNAALGRWDALLAGAPGFHATRMRVSKVAQATNALLDAPLWALAAAHHGDFATAHRQIDTTPLDCVYCMRIRAQVEALAHNWSGAAAWFVRAQAAAPSSPLVAADWGEMLLQKGDFDAAIAQFDLAHKKGPNFADPLEMWGEALIASNRSDLALPKFEEAAGHAPNWGRLHLKWGEALLWLGRRDDAAKQFAIAVTLFLTPQENAQLARVRHG
jgi:tetratricopeptide (TPR) repeat protein